MPTGDFDGIISTHSLVVNANQNEKNVEEIAVVRFSVGAKLPTRAHATDAGLDLYSTQNCVIAPGSFAVIDTGIGVALPYGTYGQVFGRSSLAIRGLFPIGGVIDQEYRGVIKVVLVNASAEEVHIQQGDKIAQLVIIRIETPTPVEVENFEKTSRGTKGFGSSGS